MLFPARARRKRRIRILKIAAICSFTTIAALALVKNEFSALQSWQVSQKLNESFGISLNVQSESLGVGVLKLGGVSIGGSATAEIASVVAQMRLNPFAKNFGRPSSVKLSDFSLDLNPQMLERMLVGSQTQSVGGVKRSANLPARVEFERGNINLTFVTSRPPFELQSVSGTLDVEAKHLVLKAEMLVSDGVLVERDITVDMRRQRDGQVRFELVRKSDIDQHKWQIKGFVSGDMQRAKLSFDLAGASPALREYFNKYVVQTEALKLAGKADLRLLTGRPQKLQIDIEARARNLSVLYPLIDRQAVTIPPTYLATRMILDPATKSIDLPRLDLATSPETSQTGSPKFVKLAAKITGIFAESTEIDIELPTTQCSDLLAVIPQTMAGEVQGFRLQGRVSAKGKFRFGKSLPFRIDSLNNNGVQTNCEVVSTPDKYSKARLRYSQSLSDASGARKLLASESLPRSAGFVELESLPAFVPKMFIAAEDRRFYAHNGFDLEAIQNAVRTNLEKSQTALGGSTISQQLAKNLFLSREKNFTRKLRETFLTWYLERYLNKQRILELYLNIAEFGPDIFGIAQASRFYFDKDPQELTLRDAALLSYLLPSPVKRSEEYRRPGSKARIERMVDRRVRHFELANGNAEVSTSTYGLKIQSEDSAATEPQKM